LGRRPATEMDQVRGALRAMVSDELRRAGQRFVSARYISQRFKVSYQTAHRLLTELKRQGLVERRAGSGSFISGQTKVLRSALLIFAGRAKRPGSFGDLLLKQLIARLESMGLPFEVLVGRVALKEVPEDVFPVLWELAQLTQHLAGHYRFSLVLHNRPPAGIGSLYTDSICVDDFSGGLAAGQIMNRWTPRRPAVIGGPSSDVRSQNRINGFHQIFPEAPVIETGTWFFRAAMRILAGRLAALRPDALFCCSDRLAEAAITSYKTFNTNLPLVIGFDNAPVSERLGFSTIGIPWEEVARNAASVIKRRLEGRIDHASAIILPPVPIIRNAS
jgi:DNA-binding transcriptional regulator YhcF (GntR family)